MLRQKPKLKENEVATIDALMHKLGSMMHAPITDSNIPLERMLIFLTSLGIDPERMELNQGKKQLIEVACEQIMLQWDEWKIRTALYSPVGFKLGEKDTKPFTDFNQTYEQFQKFNNLRSTRNTLIKLQRSLKSFHQQPPGAQFDEVRLVLLMSMMTQILKLKTAQLESLEEQQHLRRFSLQQQLKITRLHKKELNSIIEKRRDPLSKKVHKVNPEAAAFFKSREKRTRFNKHAEKVADVDAYVKIARYGLDFLHNLSQFSTAIGQAIANFASALTVLPILSQIGTVYPFILGAYKSWKKGKDRLTTALAFGAAATVGIILFATGTLFIAAGAMIATAVIGGTILQNILPWRKLRADIREQKQIIKDCSQPVDDKNPTLTQLQKQLLLLKLEQFILNKEPTKEMLKRIDDAKYAIISGSKKAISENTILQTIINGNNPKILHEYIVRELEQHKFHAQKNLLVLNHDERLARVAMVGGIFASIGAILFCIPNPITLTIAAGFFMFSGAVTLALRNKWVDKLFGRFSKSEKEYNATMNAEPPKVKNSLSLSAQKRIHAEFKDLPKQEYPPKLPQQKKQVDSTTKELTQPRYAPKLPAISEVTSKNKQPLAATKHDPETEEKLKPLRK